MIIEPEGLFTGERLAACSDKAQLMWPRLFLASNSCARLELSYKSISSRVFGNFQKIPKPSEVWEIFREFEANFLAVLYQPEDGVWWCQFITSEKYLPKYKKTRDSMSPAPSLELMEDFRKRHIEWKKSKSLSLQSFQKVSEDFQRRGIGVGTGEGVGEEQKQNPSRGKREQPTKTAIQKQAHADFKAAIDAYWKFKNPGVQMPWGPMEGAQLSMFQREAPDISLEQFKGMLNARAKSKVNHGDRPGQWIKWITSYGPGPVNEFKNTMEVNGNGGTNKTNRVGVTAERTKAARTSLAEAALARGYYTVDDALRSTDPPLPGAGECGSDAGISGGLRSVSGEVLNPGGRASGGGSTG